MSTAAECQAVSKRKITKALNRTSHHGNENPTRAEKINVNVTKTTAIHDDSENNGSTVDKKIVSSKRTSLVNTEDTNDNNTLTKFLGDGPTLETRQSLSSKARRQKHGDPLLKNGLADKRAQLIDNKPSTMKQNVTVSELIIDKLLIKK